MLPYIWGIIFVSYRQESGHIAVFRILREAIFFYLKMRKEVRDCQMYFTVPTDMFSMWIKKIYQIKEEK